jgi:hypothetical protein
MLDTGRLEWAITWRLQRGTKEHPGMRWVKLRGHLACLSGATAVAYERVEAHASSYVYCNTHGAIKATVGYGRGLRCARCMRPVARRQRMNVAAAHSYGACEGLLLEWCCNLGLVPSEVHTSAVKTTAVGKGAGAGTKKPDILAAARARWPEIDFSDDNAADAAFIALTAARRLGWAPLASSQRML